MSPSTSGVQTILAEIDGLTPAGWYVTGVAPVVVFGDAFGGLELPHAPSAKSETSTRGRISRRRIGSHGSDRPRSRGIGVEIRRDRGNQRRIPAQVEAAGRDQLVQCPRSGEKLQEPGKRGAELGAGGRGCPA